MQLLRFGQRGSECPGVIWQGVKKDVSDYVNDFDEAFFAGDGIAGLEQWLTLNGDRCPTIDDDERLGSPVARPSKLVCVGLNYAAHAAEAGLEPPTEPVLFFKSTTAICGPFDEVVLPKGSSKVDWEVELAFVMGKQASYVDEADALDYVAGYLLHNDVSERSFQFDRAGQWCKGKGCDTFAPLGPYLTSANDIQDPNNLSLWLDVNGERLQDSNTRDFIFNIQQIIANISQYMTLLPGDVISTGTPQGVGMGLKPEPRYLKAGDIMRLGVEQCGESEQRVAEYKV